MRVVLLARLDSSLALRCAAVSLVAVLAGNVGAQPPAAPAPAAAPKAKYEAPIVPVHHEPHHRQVFQYGTVRILDLQVPPGETTWFHTHEWPVLYMTLGRSTTRSQDLGGEWSGGGAPPRPNVAAATPPPAAAPAAPTAPLRMPRATSTTSYAEKPITHRLENVGEGLFRAMVVVNETKGDDTTSVEAAGFEGDGTPELTNGWFRSYRITLAPGQKTAAHSHREPVVIFQATDGKGLATGPMKFELNEPGQWAFFDSNTKHEIENTGDGPLELLEVEVRRQ